MGRLSDMFRVRTHISSPACAGHKEWQLLKKAEGTVSDADQLATYYLFTIRKNEAAFKAWLKKATRLDDANISKCYLALAFKLNRI